MYFASIRHFISPGCYLVWYCGRECQLGHWPVHQEDCKVKFSCLIHISHRLHFATTITKTKEQKNDEFTLSFLKLKLNFRKLSWSTRHFSSLTIKRKERTTKQDRFDICDLLTCILMILLIGVLQTGRGQT